MSTVPPARAPHPPLDDAAARADLEALVARGVAWPTTPAIRPNRRAAVLMLVGPGTTRAPGPDLLLVRRSIRLRHHPGEMALPGGGVEDGDADACATALREAQEETGVDPAGVRVLGPLPDAPVTVSRNLVTPVLAWWEEPSPVFAADPDEIDDVRRVPLTVLTDPARRVRAQFHPDETARPATRRWTPGIDLDDAVLWGFTGILVTTVLDALGWGARTDWDTAPVMDVTTLRRLAPENLPTPGHGGPHRPPTPA